MEVVIRLQKAGKKTNKNYNYRVVAIPRQKSRQADHLEHLGYYDPAKKPAVFKIDVAKVEAWIKKGAQLSDTVRSLLKKQQKAK